jgi:ATP-dependent exoDNAse (exonuclease V) alpha subunit
MIELSPTQSAAVQAIRNWHNNSRAQVFRLFGYAGTGKTSVVATAVADMGLRAVYAAYTGKAAAVMRNNGIPASTIHRLIYKPSGGPPPKPVVFSFDPGGMAAYSDLIVIDECSMVDERVGQDLLRYGVKLLAIGDPAQLPPPTERHGYFTKGKGDVLLTEIHRQAGDSPVLTLATRARQGEILKYGYYGSSEVIEACDLEDDRLWSADQVLCGTNATCDKLNARARHFYGMQSPLPQFGDKVVCLRNNYQYGVMNGETFTVMNATQVSGSMLHLDLVPTEGGDLVEGVLVATQPFIDPRFKLDAISGGTLALMTYAYAMTVHKSQGSQWNDVVLIDESRVFREAKDSWLYTGVTRAAKRITVAKGRI